MKKILSILVLALALPVLFACGGDGGMRPEGNACDRCRQTRRSQNPGSDVALGSRQRRTARGKLGAAADQHPSRTLRDGTFGRKGTRPYPIIEKAKRLRNHPHSAEQSGRKGVDSTAHARIDACAASQGLHRRKSGKRSYSPGSCKTSRLFSKSPRSQVQGD